jgi:hypothetical protein
VVLDGVFVAAAVELRSPAAKNRKNGKYYSSYGREWFFSREQKFQFETM